MKAKFNVLIWDFNTDTIKHYDVLPYLRNEKELPHLKIKQAKTKEELKEIIRQKSQYRYWSRCQYEMIIHGWPVQKNEYKIDVYEQIMMNIDVITDILWNEFN